MTHWMFPNRAAGACLGLAVALVALITGCEDRTAAPPSPSTPQAQTAAAGTLPAGFVLAEAPAGARDVVALKKEAKVGDEVVVRGRVGGSASPFVEGRASLQLIDASLK